MQKSQLIKPLRLADAGGRIEGRIKLASFSRLVEMGSHNNAELTYKLLFYKDKSGGCVIDAEIDADLVLQCQRCLRPLNVNVHKKTLLGIVSNTDTLQTLDEKYEPLSLEDGTLSLNRLLEDELLLATPFSALHPENKCPGKQYLSSINTEAASKPFAPLAALKDNMR